MSILSRWWRVASLATLTFIASAPVAVAQSTAEAGEALVSTEWLEKNLRNAKVRVIEVSVNPGLYERGHIPGAVNFSWHNDLNDRVRRDGQPVTLTQKEWALLRVMATRPERIHTRENLADALYGFGDEADSNTLEVFISRLRRKLGRSHIQTLRGLGYRLSADEEE
ncbi:winged helix-turn-helix domain-containing protein, partial [Pseudomonas aeruginosa]|uniref:winged helix-turn-helix domain-containing protein n=1 Tax=Pseudomonas aeruginosa TaxID=287 RepID=UPI000B0ECDBF